MCDSSCGPANRGHRAPPALRDGATSYEGHGVLTGSMVRTVARMYGYDTAHDDRLAERGGRFQDPFSF